MAEPPHDTWFYTREGERIGPVTFADLRMKVYESTLNPRLDMVWTQGMAEWKPAGEIEGLFERRTATEPLKSLAPPAPAFEKPTHASSAERYARHDTWPGYGRLSYFIGMVLVVFLKWMILGIKDSSPARDLGPEILGYFGPVANYLTLLLALYLGLKRLVNLGMSRWWYLGNFVPVLWFWVGYRLYACPPGYAYHKKLDGIGIFLAILYWLFVAIIVAACIAIAAVYFGKIGNPELQEQVRTGFRTYWEIIHKAWL